MKKVAIITATRAEYGLLAPVIRCIREYEGSDFKAELIVTGTHLGHEYGYTIDEIKNDDIRIDKMIEISTENKTDLDISKNQADTLVKFTALFSNSRYDAIIILGDRYEALMFAISAVNTHTPIFHLCGGDVTEGAIDDSIRHSITKMSYLHFVTNEESRKRVIQLGESPERVFNYGSTSIDNTLKKADMSKSEALESVSLRECRYALCTYHPVTLERNGVKDSIHSFIEAIKEFCDLEFIITKSNADQGGSLINEILDEAEMAEENIHVFSSLGVRRYLSLMKYAEFVIGNSSSGIVETPAFHIPTVNIGDRQRGRLQAKSIINCASDKDSIVDAVKTALSSEFKNSCLNVKSPYGTGNAAEMIAKKCYETVVNDNLNLMKRFYDIRVDL